MNIRKKTPMYPGGGKIVKMYEDGGQMENSGDPKFVVADGQLKMVLGSGKLTDSFTPSQLESYLKKAGFLKVDYTGGTKSEAGTSSLGSAAVADRVKSYRDTGDLTAIAELIDVNLDGYDSVIPGLPFGSDRRPGEEVSKPVGGRTKVKYGEYPAELLRKQYEQ